MRLNLNYVWDIVLTDIILKQEKEENFTVSYVLISFVSVPRFYKEKKY